MVRILDGMNVILGEGREDNMIVFFKHNDRQEEPDNMLKKRKMSYSKLLATASVLLDEGYATSFDRCIKAATVTDGDIEKARDLLSKITITEN